MSRHGPPMASFYGLSPYCSGHQVSESFVVLHVVAIQTDDRLHMTNEVLCSLAFVYLNKELFPIGPKPRA